MLTFIILSGLVLFVVVIVQIGRVMQLASDVRGKEATVLSSTKSNANLMLVFGFLFLGLTIWSGYHYKNFMIPFGPHDSASSHGGELDNIFVWTVVITGIVFFLTQIALFWFTYQFRHRKGHKATFMAHDNKLEMIWTFVPSLVMTFLVVKGLVAWNAVMSDVPPGEEIMEIEAMGQQFAWLIRYPGADGKLGDRDYRSISSTNPFGQIWDDPRNHDDFQPSEIVLPVNKPVRVRITARDVLHSFYIPYMRVKMDAVPGMPTYFVFTPTTTTEEYRNRLKGYDEYLELADPEDPELGKKWENFEYELACAELCGKGHYSMRRVVKVVSQEEYDTWLKDQKSWYEMNIKENL